MDNLNLVAHPWKDYELIDSGDNRKLERYGEFTIIRPETQAIWKPGKPDEWKKAKAEFRWSEGKGAWSKKDMPEKWELSWEDVRFSAMLTSFKHTGVFPEQVPNWEWLRKKTLALESPQVLNLFGYTGIATIAAAKAGAYVTHVDASKQANDWTKGNAKLSGIPEDKIRYMLDDGLKFAEREVRRGKIYDGIILDPPAFGRGPKGEVWKIEEDLLRLLEPVKKLLSSKKGAFLILNGYAAGYSPRAFFQAVQSFFDEENMEFGELQIEEAGSKRLVPAGIYVRFARS
ncbi:MAG: class I SAM-dependent methyltransferase [Patescibacteria group bacterium]